MNPFEILIFLKYHILDNKGWVVTVSTLTVFFLLLMAFMCFKYWRDQKQKDSEIKQLEIELASKERGKKELEKQLAQKNKAKFIYEDLLFFERTEKETYFDKLPYFSTTQVF